MISRVEHDSMQHPQPRLVQAAMACVLGYLKQKRSVDLGTLRRVLLPSNPGLLLSSVDRLIEQGAVVTRPGPVDLVLELAHGEGGRCAHERVSADATFRCCSAATGPVEARGLRAAARDVSGAALGVLAL